MNERYSLVLLDACCFSFCYHSTPSPLSSIESALQRMHNNFSQMERTVPFGCLSAPVPIEHRRLALLLLRQQRVGRPRGGNPCPVRCWRCSKASVKRSSAYASAPRSGLLTQQLTHGGRGRSLSIGPPSLIPRRFSPSPLSNATTTTTT